MRHAKDRIRRCSRMKIRCLKIQKGWNDPNHAHATFREELFHIKIGHRLLTPNMVPFRSYLCSTQETKLRPEAVQQGDWQLLLHQVHLPRNSWQVGACRWVKRFSSAAFPCSDCEAGHHPQAIRCTGWHSEREAGFMTNLRIRTQAGWPVYPSCTI